MARVGGHTFPPDDAPSALTYSLTHFRNAISAGGKDYHRCLGEALAGLLDGFMKVRRIGDVDHLHLFGRKTFGHMDNLEFLSQFLK
jgi:hypothetical protein